MSEQHADEPAIRVSDEFIEDAPHHRKRTTRQARHTARTQLHVLAGDDEALEDADVLCPPVVHDLGRHTSKRPSAPKPGRRDGFKVWKSPFWKRRNTLRAKRNAAARRVADDT